jgi:hypothetical protein
MNTNIIVFHLVQTFRPFSKQENRNKFILSQVKKNIETRKHKTSHADVSLDLKIRTEPFFLISQIKKIETRNHKKIEARHHKKIEQETLRKSRKQGEVPGW